MTDRDASDLLHDPMPGMFLPRELPDGLIEYTARCAIRDLIALHGFEKARDLTAGYLMDEADGKRTPRKAA